jgi:hypothetical protein
VKYCKESVCSGKLSKHKPTHTQNQLSVAGKELALPKENGILFMLDIETDIIFY